MKKFSLIYICLILFHFNANNVLGFSIYYTQANQGINQINSDGNNNVLLVPEPSMWIFQKIEIDRLNRRIYWTDTYADVIQRANMDGSNVETIYTAPALHGCYDLAIDTDNGKMYWSDNSSVGEHTLHTIIYKANLNGSDIQPVIYGTGRSFSIEITDGKLYWNEYTDLENYVGESLLKRANIDGTDEEILYARYTNTQIFGDSGVFKGLDVDERTNTIYWSERYPNRYVLKKSNFDGSLIYDIIEFTDDPIFGVAVDQLNNELYWLKSGIFKSDLEGNNIQLIFDSSTCNDLALDLNIQPTIDAILSFFDQSVANETLTGYGHGNSANNRLNVLRKKLQMAGDLIDIGDIDGACVHLKVASRKCDGVTPPPDFVQGDSVSELYVMITELMAELGCE